jgi:hypothetical protein
MFTLQDKFHIRCSIHYNKNKKPPSFSSPPLLLQPVEAVGGGESGKGRIYIFKESMENLRTLVQPFFVKEKFEKFEKLEKLEKLSIL